MIEAKKNTDEMYGVDRLRTVTEQSLSLTPKAAVNAILAETRRNVKTLSTIDGLKQTFQVPIQRGKKRSSKKAKREKAETSIDAD